MTEASAIPSSPRKRSASGRFRRTRSRSATTATRQDLIGIEIPDADDFDLAHTEKPQPAQPSGAVIQST